MTRPNFSFENTPAGSRVYAARNDGGSAQVLQLKNRFNQLQVPESAELPVTWMTLWSPNPPKTLFEPSQRLLQCLRGEPEMKVFADVDKAD